MTRLSKVLLPSFLVAAISMGALFGQAPKKTVTPYPKGYRHWTMVKTMVIFSNQNPLFNRFGGLHNVYVNDVGLPSLRQGKAYPDGSTFVFDLYDTSNAMGAIETRGRKFLAVMKKNAKLYPKTGGWEFEVFQGYEEKGSLQDMKQCFDCHSSQKSSDYVYSTYKE